MDTATYNSFAQWYTQGHLSAYVRTMKSAGDMLNLLEAAQPAGDMSDPAVPDLTLYQDMLGGTQVSGDMGAGRFNVVSNKGGFFIAAPNFANTVIVEQKHKLRSLSFPLSRWQPLMAENSNRSMSLNELVLAGSFDAPRIREAFLLLWRLCDDEGAPSRLLAQAAGCEILAELCRINGSPFETVRGGLASWAEKRTAELMHARMADDISLQELANEVHLSTYHFSRMFKRSFGVPPRVYLSQARVEKACELLARTDLTITEIAQEVGYSSSQVLARVFTKYKQVGPREYRLEVRGDASSSLLPAVPAEYGPEVN